MSYRENKKEISELFTAFYPFLYIVSDDEIPVIKTICEIEEEKSKNSKKVFTWNLASGLFCEFGSFDKTGFLVPAEKSIQEKVNALYKFIKDAKEESIFILQDFDYILKEHKELSFGLKEVIHAVTTPLDKNDLLKRHKKSKPLIHVVIVSPNQYIPSELEKMINVIHFGLPDQEIIENIIDKVAVNTNQQISPEEKANLVRAGYGLTETELTNALFKSVVSEGRLSPKSLVDIKEQIIKKGGLVEFSHPSVGGFKSVGGMKNIVEWVEKRKIAFNEEIRVKRNLSYPKGILMTGIQGAGKSYTVKAISEFMEMPLIKFDIGRIKGMYVGQSEENMRKAVSLAEAVAPCVLWIDEIEKAFPDPRNANTHEVSKGLLGYFLTWMQDKTKPVFVVATANNIDTLPPELLRKGRFDELFWVDLPEEAERKRIFEIHLKKIGVDPSGIDLEILAANSNGYSGAEIEDTVKQGNFNSAYDDVPLTTTYILEELEKTTPISIIRKDAIDEMRQWATNNKVRAAN